MGRYHAQPVDDRKGPNRKMIQLEKFGFEGAERRLSNFAPRTN
jgi:hypothetical protein